MNEISARHWYIYLGMWPPICFTPTLQITSLMHPAYVTFPSRLNIKFNTLRPRQNGRHFPDDIFKWIFLNENVWISISISLKFVPRDPINNIPTLVQVMAWRRPGDKPLSEPMMVRLPTHICVTRPQWVKYPGFTKWILQMACDLSRVFRYQTVLRILRI